MMCNEAYVAYFKNLLVDVSGTTSESGINLCTSRLSDRESKPGPPYYGAGAVTLTRGLTAQRLYIRKLQKCV
jgi:hypothetical protein